MFVKKSTSTSARCYGVLHNFWIRTLSPPCSFEGFGVQDLKTFFKSNSIILLPPQLRLGYLVIHHIENLFHSCEKLKIEKNPCLS